VGKTLISGMLVRHLAHEGRGPVLAVDADANSNLHEVLGVERGESVGSIREEMKKLAGEMPGGMSKPEFIEYKVETALSEEQGFDLLVMGRPEGPGCYCYANNLLRDVMRRLAGRYDHVVVDNEAGMEHLSRRLIQDMDLLLVISDPSLRGIETAFRLCQIPDEVETHVGAKALVVNRVPNSGLSAEAKQRIQQGPIPLLGCIPEDADVMRCDQAAGNFASLYPDSPFARCVVDVAARLGG
jgi:CO dehydrogenase maturation factor